MILVAECKINDAKPSLTQACTQVSIRIFVYSSRRGRTMKIKSVEVRHFKNILDSGVVDIQPDVTCIVGKNESGKTAFLQALHRFLPIQPNVSFDIQRQYPAWLEKQHRRQNIIEQKPVTVTFELEDAEWNEIQAKFGQGALTEKTIAISRTYENTFSWTPPAFSEHIVVGHILTGINLEDDIRVPETFADLGKVIEELRTATYADEERTKTAHQTETDLIAARTSIFGGETDFSNVLWGTIEPWLPHFFYFDEYSQLPGSVKIRELLAKDKKGLKCFRIDRAFPA